MRIPDHTVLPRFYVATDDKTAFSSWDSLEDARECCKRFYTHDRACYELIFAIVETGPGKKKFYDER